MHNVESKEHEEFSYTLFARNNAIQFALILSLFWLLLPKSVWEVQIQASWWKMLVVFLSMKMFNCFMEYFFHRYVLHKPAISFLSYFYMSHTQHHNLTRIGKRRLPKSGREIPYVDEIENKFPMITPEQRESAFFPWYSLLVFSGVITPILVVCQWMMPSYPWFIGGSLALLASLTLYEFIHAVEHWDLKKWDPLLEHPQWGSFWRKVYSFHVRHHAVIDCNEAISGFLIGIPVADIVFGTLVLPRSLYPDGGEWEEKDFVSPTPVWFIRWLDKVADDAVANRRRKAWRG